tara:strand:+ start:934 stop:1362 length:429 start_codon:yes stop_codon:yes gene_type:complete
VNKFVMTAMAVVLFSTTANANTISIQCKDTVERGTLKLTNPPTMNCDDFKLVQKYVGSGVSVGPNSKIDELVSTIEKLQLTPKSQPVAEVTKEPLGDHFNGIRRHEGWFNVSEKATSCKDDGWFNIKLEDGGVTIRRNEFSQ